MAGPLIWLASFPRSGNTFLRTVLYQCFGLPSASVYPRDLGHAGTEVLAGHIEHSRDGSIDFGDAAVRLLKTHGRPQDERPAIYMLRDGRAACVSLYHFYNGQVPMEQIVRGRTRFGSWATHLSTWSPALRPNTLLLRYEDLRGDLSGSLDRIAEHIGVEPKTRTMPSRAELAKSGSQWIRPESAERICLEGEPLERFWEVNGDAMRTYGYA